MTRTLINIGLSCAFFTTLLITAAHAQKSDQVCRGPVYTPQQLTHRAKLTRSLDIAITDEARVHDVHGKIIVEAILCRTGKVTDLKVIQGLPYGMTENALAVVLNLRFMPAELNWHSVSQRMRFEFRINERGAEGVDTPNAAGRLVEEVDVVGNRRLGKDDILASTRTRPGDLYSQDQIEHDFNAILATGYFDKLRSRVTTEVGVRGGVVVIFETFELPLISEVKFEGLKDVTESVIMDALLKENIDVRKGAVFDPAKVRSAVRVIRNSLESKGQGNANVEVRTENVTATAIALTFVIK